MENKFTPEEIERYTKRYEQEQKEKESKYKFEFNEYHSPLDHPIEIIETLSGFEFQPYYTDSPKVAVYVSEWFNANKVVAVIKKDENKISVYPFYDPNKKTKVYFISNGLVDNVLFISQDDMFGFIKNDLPNCTMYNEKAVYSIEVKELTQQEISQLPTFGELIKQMVERSGISIDLD